MGLFDDVFGSSVPKGNLAKPLLIALGALLSVGGFAQSVAGSRAHRQRRPVRQRAGCSGDSRGCCSDFSKTVTGMLSIRA